MMKTEARRNTLASRPSRSARPTCPASRGRRSHRIPTSRLRCFTHLATEAPSADEPLWQTLLGCLGFALALGLALVLL